MKTLVENSGDLVTKQALMRAVWPGTIVEEANLTVQIATLRKVLDEGRTDAQQGVASRPSSAVDTGSDHRSRKWCHCP